MKFSEYLKKLLESNPEKRAVLTYGSLYPGNYGTTYRLQYGSGIKNSRRKRSKKKK